MGKNFFTNIHCHKTTLWYYKSHKTDVLQEHFKNKSHLRIFPVNPDHGLLIYKTASREAVGSVCECL